MTSQFLPPSRLLAPISAFPGPFSPEFAGGVVAIGNFDGVHLGHQLVLARTVEIAKAKQKQPLVLTFEPHPRSVFSPDNPPFILTPADEKARLLGAFGIKNIAFARFDREFIALSAEDFITRLLVDWMQISAVIVGEDFRFGSRRLGDITMLQAAGKKHGFDVHALSQRQEQGDIVSSTRIRNALQSGDVFTANTLLGHAYFVSGDVIHGQQLGRTLKYPTANVKTRADSALAHGIYAVLARVGETWHPAVASYGRRPTFDNGAPLLETHLFDFTGDLYGQVIDVAFLSYLRPELKFDTVEALVVQMDADSAKAREIIAQSGLCQ